MTITEQHAAVIDTIRGKNRAPIDPVNVILNLSDHQLELYVNGAFEEWVSDYALLKVLELCRRRILKFSQEYSLAPSEDTWDDTSKMLFLIAYPEFREHFE